MTNLEHAVTRAHTKYLINSDCLVHAKSSCCIFHKCKISFWCSKKLSAFGWSLEGFASKPLWTPLGSVLPDPTILPQYLLSPRNLRCLDKSLLPGTCSQSCQPFQRLYNVPGKKRKRCVLHRSQMKREYRRHMCTRAPAAVSAQRDN